MGTGVGTGVGLGFRVGTGVGEGLKLRHSTVAPAHTFRLRLGWDWGLGCHIYKIYRAMSLQGTYTHNKTPEDIVNSAAPATRHGPRIRR